MNLNSKIILRQERDAGVEVGWERGVLSAPVGWERGVLSASEGWEGSCFSGARREVWLRSSVGSDRELWYKEEGIVKPGTR